MSLYCVSWRTGKETFGLDGVERRTLLETKSNFYVYCARGIGARQHLDHNVKRAMAAFGLERKRE